MGLYIGKIEKVMPNEKSLFYNYKPLAEVKNHQIFTLTSEEQERILPQSDKRDILLSFDYRNEDERRRMDSFFSEKSLILFEFHLSELQLNVNFKGEINQTGYKVSAMEMLDTGKIHLVGNSGVYFAIEKTQIKSDFFNDVIVDIETPYLSEGVKVFIELDNFWAGPYEVGYRTSAASYSITPYFIKPEIKKNKYTVSGYRPNQINQFNLGDLKDDFESEGLLLCLKKDEKPDQLDVISDSILIESFKASIESGSTVNGVVKLDDIPKLLKQYEESEIIGSILTEETRRSRLNRLVSIMSSEKDMDNTLHTIADVICNLLITYQDSPNVDEWLQTLFKKNPQLLDQLKGSQIISNHIAELQAILDDLIEQKNSLEQKIERQRAESIEQQAIEAKKRAMLEQEAEYANLAGRIEDQKKLLGLVGGIGELQDQYTKLEKTVKDISTHKDFLSSETKGLELQFQQMISRTHDDMVRIAFDGFMASKMLHAAAEWEAEQTNNQHIDFIDKIASIPIQNKTPEELVEYLCQIVQIRRPNYSKNVIINIAICLTQGFLTVFSGEPGCGKTSICNIFGQALGLNKLSNMIDCPEDRKESAGRYVAVSVERGWTSKRDFVGYYNPLSKTFDRSNRRIYDALHQLDTEKRLDVLKFPYIILLDEANLSPMEYYWSDFMNICDDLGPDSKVNLGEDYVFGIPETLHFVATINNDHTTETLSPRLIDRAWVITLPQLTLRDYGSSICETNISEEIIEVISWNSLREAFIPAEQECLFTPEIQKCYDSIIAKLREKKFSVSSRINIAIKRYWTVASKYFEMDDTKTDATIIALDYAIAQRILPKIIGNGEDFERWLNEFSSLCSNNGLNTSATMLKDIIERGNQKMKYYQFFY